MKIILTAAAIVLMATGCNMNCVVGTGTPVQKEMDLAPFTKIDVEGATDVTVIKGEPQQVVITAEPNILALMDTTVSGDTWRIGASGCYSTSTGIHVRITTPALSSMSVEGSGDVRTADVFGAGPAQLACSGSGNIAVDGINANKLSVDIEGSGSITVKGTCGDLDGTIEGSGDLHAKDLVANSASLSVSGSGTATITAITTLEAEVQGSGEIHYAGKPEVESKVQGSGSVTPL